MTPKDYLKEPYARVLTPDETGGFNAEVLEFPGCFAQGDTVEQAYKELEDAAEAWIEVRLGQGQEVPRPFSNLDYSGTISLRIPRSIHKRAAVMAERDRVSLNSFLMAAIASRVGAEDFYIALTNRLERRMMEAADAYRQQAQTVGRDISSYTIQSGTFQETARTQRTMVNRRRG